MPKLHGLPIITAPVVGDFLAGTQASGPTDVEFTIQNLINILAANLYQPYKFAAWANSATTIAAGFVATKVAFNTTEYDTSSNYDNVTNFRFTAPVAGFYFFAAAVQSNSGGTGDYWILNLYKNGAQFKAGPALFGNTTNLINVNICPPGIQLAAGDYIEIYCIQNGGGTHATYTGEALTYFGGYLLSST